MSCSSLALAIERKKARDGLVAIPRSNKREKMMKRKRSEIKGQNFSTDEYIEEKEEDSFTHQSIGTSKECMVMIQQGMHHLGQVLIK